MAVYFIQIGGDPLNAPVKIGFATKPSTRLVTMQSGHYLDYRFLRIVEGTLADEKRMHQKFQHLRIRGEWFHFSGDMLEDVGLPDLPIPIRPSTTLRGGPMPTSHRAAIAKAVQLSWNSGSLNATRSIQEQS